MSNRLESRRDEEAEARRAKGDTKYRIAQNRTRIEIPPVRIKLQKSYGQVEETKALPRRKTAVL